MRVVGFKGALQSLQPLRNPFCCPKREHHLRPKERSGEPAVCFSAAKRPGPASIQRLFSGVAVEATHFFGDSGRPQWRMLAIRVALVYV